MKTKFAQFCQFPNSTVHVCCHDSQGPHVIHVTSAARHLDFPRLKIAVFYCNSPSLCVSKGIGGTSSSQSVSAEPRLADRDGVGSRTCGLMPTGEDLDSRDSVDERPLSAARLSAETETRVWHFN